MAPDLAARQMRAARDSILAEDWKKVAHPAMAPFSGFRSLSPEA